MNPGVTADDVWRHPDEGRTAVTAAPSVIRAE